MKNPSPVSSTETEAAAPATIADALDALRSLAPRFRDDWMLIGSAAAQLAGAETGAVRDVDVLMSARDAQTLAALWPAPRRALPAPSAQFRSAPFFRFGGPAPLEVMANFEICVDGAWRPIAPAPGLRVNGLPIAAPADQIALLALMGREKDRVRIDALKRLL